MDDDESEDQRLGIQSVEIAAEILGALAAAGRFIALKDLSQRCGYPGGKVHRYLVSLTRSGLVDQEPTTGHYGVGRGAVAIGLSGLWAASPTREAARALSELRDASGETAFAAIWTEMGPVVSMLEESERPIYMNIRVGALLPMNASAAGRVFQAHRARPEIARALRLQERVASPATRSFTASEMKDVATRVRAAGHAAVGGLIVNGVNALAAPVFDYRGAVTIAMGLLGREGELSINEDSDHVATLLAVARATSERLGYRQP